MHLSRPRSDERGAVAVLYGVLAVVLLSFSALAVDLGNTVSRRTSTQTQADFAALAGASKLNATALEGATPATDVVDEVRDYLNSNQPQDDERACWRTSPPSCVSSAHLTDGVLTNGEVRHTASGLQVVAPQTRVDFGFATVFGVDGTYVRGAATVNVFTGGRRVMPMFAAAGCDFGRQTLTDPAGGHVEDPTVPTLAYSTQTNNTDLSSLSLADSSSTTVVELAPSSTGNILTLTASKWDNSRYIGFFRGDNPDDSLVVSQHHFWLQSDLMRTDLSLLPTEYTSNPSQTVQALIPDVVAETEGVWYVRVFNGTDAAGNWSPQSEALPLRVGGAVLECAAGSSDGNFGTLKFPRTDVTPSQEIAANIADGLQLPLTPTVHQWAVDNPTLAGECTDGTDGAVESSGSSLRPGTNCVDTVTGLPANVATQGLITGVGLRPGALTTAPTATGCDPLGGSSDRTVEIQSDDYSINNDVLTCYLTDGTTSLATISSPTYAGPAVLDASIFASPRFAYVPVLAVEPGSGGSARYSIIDFRPAFITDEQSVAAAVRGSQTGTADNGLTIPGNDVTSINVVFFNWEALPRDGDYPVIDFLGVGNPVVRLID